MSPQRRHSSSVLQKRLDAFAGAEPLNEGRFLPTSDLSKEAVRERPSHPRGLIELGFIGQGWIGRHLADHFSERGFSIRRYDITPQYKENKASIAECDIVFIAVPTPTTPEGFDDSILRGVLPLVGEGKIAVIKSTVLPGTTDALQKEYPNILILHVPEFLREVSVRRDIEYPDRNIIGIPTERIDDPETRAEAQKVLEILPPAPYELLCAAVEAELTKYGGNNFLYAKLIFMNVLYDLAQSTGARFDIVAANLRADPRVGPSHLEPVHQYNHMGAVSGRGAGGHCFPKDFAAMRLLYEKLLPDEKEAIALLKAFEAKNIQLLTSTGKDLNLLKGVYGEEPQVT